MTGRQEISIAGNPPELNISDKYLCENVARQLFPGNDFIARTAAETLVTVLCKLAEIEPDPFSVKISTIRKFAEDFRAMDKEDGIAETVVAAFVDVIRTAPADLFRSNIGPYYRFNGRYMLQRNKGENPVDLLGRGIALNVISDLKTLGRSGQEIEAALDDLIREARDAGADSCVVQLEGMRSQCHPKNRRWLDVL